MISNPISMGRDVLVLCRRGLRSFGDKYLVTTHFLLVWFFSRSGADASSTPRERVNYLQVLSAHLPDLLSGT